MFCAKADKARIAKKLDTVNHELNQVERTCWRAYISGITDVAARYGDTCTIGVFLLSSDLTHNHGVEHFLPSIARNIFKSNYVESVCALNALFLGAL